MSTGSDGLAPSDARPALRPSEIRYHQLVSADVYDLITSKMVVGRTISGDGAVEALGALLEVGTEIQAKELHLDAVLELIVERAQELTSAELAWLVLLEEGGNELSVRVSRGHRTKTWPHAGVELGRGVGGVAVKEGRTVVVPDYPHYVHDTGAATRHAVEGEGIVSLICAPMLRGSHMIGALYIGNRRETEFTATMVATMTALANQASVAIENGRLYRQLEEKNSALEQAFASHRDLTQTALTGDGIGTVAETLARLLQRTIVVRQEIVQPNVSVHLANGHAVDHPSDGDGHVRSIVAAGEPVGEVTVLNSERLSEPQSMTLDYGVTLLALELLKERAAQDVEWRLRGELLEELLDVPGEPPERVIRRAKRVGVDLTQPYRIMTVDATESGPGTLIGAVRATLAATIPDRRTVLTAQYRTSVIVALLDNGDCHREIAEAILRGTSARGMPASVGVSSPGRDFARALRASRACLSLTTAVGTHQAILDYDDLGPMRFMLDASNIDHAMEVILERLTPLIAYDREHNSELVPTLRAYVEADGSLVHAAERSFIHVSTLKYRLRRIRELLGTAPGDADVKFELRLAFRLVDLLEALDIEISPEP